MVDELVRSDSSRRIASAVRCVGLGWYWRYGVRVWCALVCRIRVLPFLTVDSDLPFNA